MTDEYPRTFTSRRRRELFLEMAALGGVTVPEVYGRAVELGDTATVEAYYNIGRRLAHRSLLKSDPSVTPTIFTLGAEGSEQWLEESDLAELVDPEYPLAGITVWREAILQINDVPESVWIELRERLAGVSARDLYTQAIESYMDDFHAAVSLAELHDEDEGERAKAWKKVDADRHFLVRFTKYALGLSDDAVFVPGSVDQALRMVAEGRDTFVDPVRLRQEIERRVEDAPMVLGADEMHGDDLIVGAVDGSSRGGLLSLMGEGGDFRVAHAPLVSINTAVGEINRMIDFGNHRRKVFTRLPERPEDMQRHENRHTVMAKLLHPDLTDGEYMHAVWNAMDLIEIRATRRLLRRWYAEGAIEIPPAHVVLRDGTVTPQERDFTHYKQADSYGEITRDIIEASWEVALLCKDQVRCVCGVVKSSQLSVFAPVINWFACRSAAEGSGQLRGWPLESMNVVPDQLIVTRLLTAGRRRGDPWERTCVVARPFHAVTSLSYRRARTPAATILDNHKRAREQSDEDRQHGAFWADFQGESDSYVKMLKNVQYASFYLAVVPRLDNDNMLPRFELLLPIETNDDEPQPWDAIHARVRAVLAATRSVGFDVGAEHDMFLSEPRLDILPKLLLRAHDTVKIWAAELLNRVQEYVGYHLARHARIKGTRGVQVRPFTKAQLEDLYRQLRQERERQAGSRGELTGPDR